MSCILQKSNPSPDKVFAVHHDSVNEAGDKKLGEANCKLVLPG